MLIEDLHWFFITLRLKYKLLILPNPDHKHTKLLSIERGFCDCFFLSWVLVYLIFIDELIPFTLHLSSAYQVNSHYLLGLIFYA